MSNQLLNLSIWIFTSVLLSSLRISIWSIQGKRGRGRRKSAGWKSLLLREEVGGALQREAQGTLPLRPRPEREMYMRRVLQGPGEAWGQEGWALRNGVRGGAEGVRAEEERGPGGLARMAPARPGSEGRRGGTPGRAAQGCRWPWWYEAAHLGHVT